MTRFFYSQLLLKLFLECKHHLEQKEVQNLTSVHFVETQPSVFREVPWVRLHECKVRMCNCDAVCVCGTEFMTAILITQSFCSVHSYTIRSNM